MASPYASSPDRGPDSRHRPALLAEVTELSAVGPGAWCIDATLGDGGHARAILEATAPNGMLLGLDADPQALERARTYLQPFASRLILVNDNFANLQSVVERHHFRPVLAVLMDLGLSSWQLEAAARGFSFRDDVYPDMRLSPSQPVTAAAVVNTFSQAELARIIASFGEEPEARRIASAIVRHRPIATALRLAQVIEEAVPRRGRRISSATKSFQAIRVFVNREMENLQSALGQAVSVLAKGGRLLVIAYESLTDRLVKAFMRQEARDCICPPGQPICTCSHRASVRVLNRKVVKPSAVEVRENPRVRSARLRACVALGTMG